MTQQMSQLRVEAQMDGAGNYVADATAMARANNELDRSMEAMGLAAEEANVTILNAVPGFERYRLRVDATARAERDLERVRRAGASALEQGQATQQQVNETIAEYERRLEAAKAKAVQSYGAVKAGMREAADETRRYADEGEKAVQVSGRLDGAMGLLAKAAAVLGVAFSIRELTGLFNATEDRVLANERAVLRLNAQLAVTGGAVGKSLGDIQRLARQIERETGVAEQAILDRAAALTTFTSIAGDQFDRTMRVAVDMAEVYQQDLKSAIEAVGRAMEQPLKGMGMLERQGFRLEAQQKEQIKTLLEAGKQYEAQEIVLRMLEDLVGGTAAAAYAGLAEAQGSALISGQRLLEQWYEQSGAAATAEAIARTTGATFEWLALNTRALADAAQFAALSLGGLLVARSIVPVLAALTSGAVSAIAAIGSFALANNAYTASSLAAAAATRGFAAAIGFLGGPLGAVLAAAGLGAAAWLTYGRALDTSSEAIDRNRRVMDELRSTAEAHGFSTLNEAAFALRRAEASDALTKSLMREAQAELDLAEARTIARGGAGPLGVSGSDVSADANAARVAALRERLNDLGGELDSNGDVIRAIREEIVRLGEAASDTSSGIASLTDEQLKLRQSALDGIRGIEENTKALIQQAEAYRLGERAVIEARIAGEVRAAKLKNRMVDEEALTRALTAQAAAQQRLSAAQRLANDEAETAVAAARARAAMIADPAARRAAETAIERQVHLNRLTREYVLELERIPELMNEFDRRKAYEQQAQFFEDVRRKAEEISSDISQFLVDGFVNAERGGRSAFENLWDGAMAGLKRFLANMAAEFLKQRFILPIVTAFVGGSAGLMGIVAPGGSGGAAQTAGGGGTGIFGALGGLLNGGLSSSFLTNIGLDIANSGVGSALGLSMAMPKGGSMVTGLGANFAGALGNLPYAGVGGLLGGMLGFGSGNGIIDGGLSLLGGIGGSMLATSAIGTSIGTALGIGGAALGPIGAVVGGLLGTLAGGLFGGKPSNNFAMRMIETGSWSVGDPIFDAKERSQGTIDASTAMADAFVQASRAILALTGGQGPAGGFVVAGERDGFQAGVGREGIHLFNAAQYGKMASFSDPEKAVEWMIAEFARQITGVEDENFRKALAYGGNYETIIGNLEFVQRLNALTDDGSMALVNALRAVNEEFDAMTAQAQLLGIATVDLEAARQRELAATRAQFEATIRGLQAQANSASQQYFAQTLDPLTQFRDSVLRRGQLSNMSGRDQYLYAQSLFRGIDETTSASEVVSLGQQYLTLAREYGASGAVFTDAFREVNAIVSGLIGTREQEKRDFEALGITFATAVSDQTEALKASIERLQEEVRKLRRAQEQAAA